MGGEPTYPFIPHHADLSSLTNAQHCQLISHQNLQ